MKKFIPLIVLLFGAIWLAKTLVPRDPPTEFDVNGFGKLPILVNGRVKPLDTVARTALLQFQGRQRVTTPDESKVSPIEWLITVFFDSTKSDTYRTFEIVHPDVLSIFDLKTQDGDKKKRFSFNQLQAGLPELMRQSELAQPVEAQKRTPFQRGIVQLHLKAARYQELKHSIVLPDSDDFLGELLRFQDALPAGIAAVRAKQQGLDYNEDAFQAMIVMGKRYDRMSAGTRLHPVPPPANAENQLEWYNTGRALLDTFQRGGVDPTVLAYAGLAHAWRNNQPERFNKIISLVRPEFEKRFAAQLVKSDIETRFNAAKPFYTSMVLYVLAFLLAVFSWLKWPDTLGRSAFWLIVLAFAATTVGIATRMWLEGRPPVTNLYSSALFVGWGAVLLCVFLEAIFKNAIGSVAAGLIGFGTLLIAHHLSLSGDTLEMMRAVLDSNFWLATHVVVITIGYSATYLAGFLALIYVVRGLFTSSLDKATAKSLSAMVYGIVCFATLFSLIGTILGGIWADDSWGRFWGWDPKENGALIIVLWNAIILHARWGGHVKQRGIMCLAIFGNIVTSWSWFGTNMLGVGLHSYGFMDAAFWALTIFVATQLGFIAIGNIPLNKWRSFRTKQS
ncbi:MAG: cytochrome C biogenesis protein [Opitutaceae bacterium]|nr:cytochrome C biogenesis protein [Opitutaceae bacterium]